MASIRSHTVPTAPPRTAKAAVYEAPNAPFVVREFPLRRVRRGEALVRVTMSTICRSDIHSYQGRRPNPSPRVLGHEIISVIEEIGEDANRDMRGDKRNDFKLNHNFALAFCLSMIFSENRCPLFRLML
jgi:hypothetical protein